MGFRLSKIYTRTGDTGETGLGDGANVYLASAELASVASILGRLPSVEEYMAYAAEINTMAAV